MVGEAVGEVAEMDAGLVRRKDRAERLLAAFELRYGEMAVLFAEYVAFPLTVTTELSYCLRERFCPEAEWSVAAVVLSSGLCDAVGYDLYELKSGVRAVLLARLVGRSGGERVLGELVGFMAGYIQARLGCAGTLDFGAEPEWIALACLRSADEVTRLIVRRLKEMWAEDGDQSVTQSRFRLGVLVESQTDLLAMRGFRPIDLKELRLVAQDLEGEVDETSVAERMKRAGFPELKTMEVSIAILEVGVELEVGLVAVEGMTVRLDRAGTVVREERVEGWKYTETRPEGLNLEMVAIPSGRFFMGSPPDEKDRFDDEGPRHEVTVQPFFMGQYPVTQRQWKLVAGLEEVDRTLKKSPSEFEGEDCPVESVSWEDAVEFCARLSRVTGRGYRLPTEAEWEYACRAGTDTPFYFGETISGRVANYKSSVVYQGEPAVDSRGRTNHVKEFPPNGRGLYDIYGNVLEWCADDWHNNYDGAPIVFDKVRPNDGSARKDASNDSGSRILRGGSWFHDPGRCRSAYRLGRLPGLVSNGIGFRLVCDFPRTLLYQN